MGDHPPLIVIPDTHGHLHEVEALLGVLRQSGYLRGHRLAFLGDYVDRGPNVRELVNLCIALRAEGHVCIAGNHEYTLEMALRQHPDRDAWIQRWADTFESQTLASYGIPRPNGSLSAWRRAADALAARMPPAHREFLTTLPSFHEDDQLILVHAGLTGEPWEAQRAALTERGPHGDRGPAQLFSHTLAATVEHPTPKIVVSGHAIRTQPLISARRVLLNYGVEVGGPLVAWISDENRCLAFR